MVKKKTNVVKKRATKKTAKKRVAKKAGSLVGKTTKKTPARIAKKTAKKSVRRVSTKMQTVADFERALTQAKKQLDKAREKQLSVEQKTVDKLKKSLARALSKQQTARARKVAAAERAGQRKSQAARDQAARARQALRLANETVKAIRLQLKDSKEVLKAGKEAKNKELALDKLLARFEREWSKASAAKRKIVRTKRKASDSGAQTTAQAPAEDEASKVKPGTDQALETPAVETPSGTASETSES